MLVSLLCSCSVNKFIPEEHYLLDEVSIVSDTKEVQPSLFTSYIRQNPNSKWFNLVKVPMHIYCLTGNLFFFLSIVKNCATTPFF